MTRCPGLPLNRRGGLELAIIELMCPERDYTAYDLLMAMLDRYYNSQQIPTTRQIGAILCRSKSVKRVGRKMVRVNNNPRYWQKLGLYRLVQAGE